MGARREDGSEYQAANGYWYRKVNGKWKLKHHIVAEEGLGRPLSQGERVIFLDKDRNNLDPSNIKVVQKKSSKEDRIAYLESKIAMYQEELDELRSR
jgi:hypothetical protein